MINYITLWDTFYWLSSWYSICEPVTKWICLVYIICHMHKAVSDNPYRGLSNMASIIPACRVCYRHTAAGDQYPKSYAMQTWDVGDWPLMNTTADNLKIVMIFFSEYCIFVHVWLTICYVNYCIIIVNWTVETHFSDLKYKDEYACDFLVNAFWKYVRYGVVTFLPAS